MYGCVSVSYKDKSAIHQVSYESLSQCEEMSARHYKTNKESFNEGRRHVEPKKPSCEMDVDIDVPVGGEGALLGPLLF